MKVNKKLCYEALSEKDDLVEHLRELSKDKKRIDRDMKAVKRNIKILDDIIKTYLQDIK